MRKILFLSVAVIMVFCIYSYQMAFAQMGYTQDYNNYSIEEPKGTPIPYPTQSPSTGGTSGFNASDYLAYNNMKAERVEVGVVPKDIIKDPETRARLGYDFDFLYETWLVMTNTQKGSRFGCEPIMIAGIDGKTCKEIKCTLMKTTTYGGRHSYTCTINFGGGDIAVVSFQSVCYREGTLSDDVANQMKVDNIVGQLDKQLGGCEKKEGVVAQ